MKRKTGHSIGYKKKELFSDVLPYEVPPFFQIGISIIFGEK